MCSRRNAYFNKPKVSTYFNLSARSVTLRNSPAKGKVLSFYRLYSTDELSQYYRETTNYWHNVQRKARSRRVARRRNYRTRDDVIERTHPGDRLACATSRVTTPRFRCGARRGAVTHSTEIYIWPKVAARNNLPTTHEPASAITQNSRRAIVERAVTASRKEACEGERERID